MKRIFTKANDWMLEQRAKYEIGANARWHRIIFALVGILILFHGISSLTYAQGTFDPDEYDPGRLNCAVYQLFRLIEGAFGALVMVVSGLGAIMAAAMGAYRASLGMLVVAVGSFILRSLVSLFFGTDFECDLDN